MQVLDTELKDVKILIFDRREDIRGVTEETSTRKNNTSFNRSWY